MRAWLALMLVAGCSLYTKDGGDDAPAVSSTVELKEVPLVNQPKLDVIVVVDNSPAMAEVREHVVEQLAAAVRTTDRSQADLRFSVVASDGVYRGGASSRGRADGPIEDDVAGDFAVEVATLADVGSTGANFSLDAMASTYSTRLVFADRPTFVVFVVGSDDMSPLPPNAYQAIPNVRTAIVAPAASTFPRLDEFLLETGTEPERFDLASDFGSQLSLAPLEWPLVGEPCFDDAPLGACTVSYRWAQGEEVIPECLHDPNARPCWVMQTAPNGECTTSTQQIHIRHANESWFWMMVDPDFPSGTELLEQCAVDR